VILLWQRGIEKVLQGTVNWYKRDRLLPGTSANNFFLFFQENKKKPLSFFSNKGIDFWKVPYHHLYLLPVFLTFLLEELL